MADTQLEAEPGPELLAPRLPTLARLASVGICFAIISVAALVLNVASWRSGGVTILWPSNGLLVGVLLCTPRRQWPSFLLLGYFIDLRINPSLHETLGVGCYFSTCNMLEVYLAAALLYPVISPDPDVTRRRQLLYLLLFGVVIPPAIASFFASFFIKQYFAIPDLHSFEYWFAADALGIAIVTPLYLSFHRRARFAGRSRWEVAAHFLVLALVAMGVFSAQRYPILFLITPLLLFLGMRLRLAGSALGLLIVCTIGGIVTAHGRGPFQLIRGVSFTTRILSFQFFLGVTMLLLYVVEVMTSESNRLQLSLQASENRFRLLAEASRDVIVLTDLTGKRRYVSPAVEEILGWSPDEMIGKRYHQIVHPEDLGKMEQLLAECRAGKPYNTFSYRCLRKDGDYQWMEANLRLYNDPVTGEPAGFVNVVRDIATRKAAEEKLHHAFHLVESLASIDGLTGLANRRCFDQTIEIEWRRAMRDRTPLSLLILDVDHFKLYNDLYGHLKGDACLRLVANCARSVVHRPADLLTRYGGEEFVVILPNTESSGALVIAEQIRSEVERLDLLQEESPHGRITVSIGCATMMPQRDATYQILFADADRALYQAKATGRNRTETAAVALVSR
jgi:diguanylate cyclase (GGDEF)-like protein/PAS domain S-box-containing protein